ncbi:hypothetical protein [Salipiger mangrovisoli]|uniref:CDP-Glycerol:Poly(Glycerophosphate) glycerophosphotransferase n=1 Tax=Salipiger mangrovisoli TaxID=2865933 RepID=A0ABR9XAP2_9RHOB|nr:hypothetical protein [Salipiger mangrovisoli]MBE9640520.1 hypothetical protein [Salipiger mangrovisoli]
MAMADSPSGPHGEALHVSGSARPLGPSTPLKGAVYVDSPVVSAIRQIRPFFESGIFCRAETPLFLKRRASVDVQLRFSRLRGAQAGSVERCRSVTDMPLSTGGVVFYPFNSQSNLNAVTNRHVFHVLTLHGESNKSASQRPAARLYDYVTAAGPLARDRYLEARIFSREDVDNGRLLMMGDSFVQGLPWIRAATNRDDDPAILYCPTWEGYGDGRDCYSSLPDRRGFHILEAALRATRSTRVVIKPHPYLGLLRRSLIHDLVQGIRSLKDQRVRVELALGDANWLTRAACRLHLPRVTRLHETREQIIPLRMGLCDVSGMEAIMLKQRIPHMVITRSADIPEAIGAFYLGKTIRPDTAVDHAVRSYLDAAEDTDAQHRTRVFGYQEPALEQMDSAARRAWLIDHVQRNPFWTRAGRPA